jgi:hypothetical protein
MDVRFCDLGELRGDHAPALLEVHYPVLLQRFAVPMTDAAGVAGAGAFRLEADAGVVQGFGTHHKAVRSA